MHNLACSVYVIKNILLDLDWIPWHLVRTARAIF